MKEYYTFMLNGGFVYLGVGGSAYNMPIFRDKNDALIYASRYTVKYDSIVKIQMRPAQ